MAETHGRYEELAVGHVLGGLSATQSADFRHHLQTCAGCRSRVAELHGIADDLAAAERDERARTAVRTEVSRQVEGADGSSGRPRIGTAQVTVAVLVVLALATAMAFWNLHLRTTAAAYLGVVEAQGEALSRLATGVELTPEYATGVDGRVVTDGSAVTMTLTGLDPLAEGERMVAWFGGAEDEAAPAPQVLAGSGGLAEGTFAVSLDVGGATELRVTRESGVSQGEPQGPMVVQVTLVVDRSR